MKKILVYLCCIGILLSALSCPAHATEVDLYSSDSGGYNYIDLMESVIKFGYSKDAVTNFYNGIDVQPLARWYFSIDPVANYSTMSQLYITLFSNDSTMTDCILYADNSLGYITPTLVGVYNDSRGFYYQYKFTELKYISELKFAVRFNTTKSDRLLGITSAIAIGYNAEVVDKVNYYEYKWEFRGDDLVRDPIAVSTGRSIPFSSTIYDNDASGWYENQYYLDFPDDYTKLDLYDSCYLLFDYVGEIYDIRASYYVGSDLSPVQIFSINTIDADAFKQFESDAVPYDHALRTVLVKVDLAGAPLDGGTLDISFSIQSMLADSADREFTYFELRSVWFMPPVTQQPWYVRFWHWMSGGLDNLGDRITDKLDSIFGDTSGGALAEAGAAMSDQAAAMDQAQAQLDQVVKPSVDASSLLDGFTNFNTGGLSVLSALTGNPKVTAMLTVTFTFCLCGYIFFGKRM